MSGKKRTAPLREGVPRLRLASVAVAALCVTALMPPSAGAAPAGRAYEMVSPPAKSNGGVVFGHRASDDGNAIAFQLNAATGPDDAAFALTTHIAHRTADGWVSRSAAPPIRAEHRGTSEISMWPADFSDDFTRAYVLTNDNVDPGDQEPVVGGNLGSGFDYYRFDPLSRQETWLTRPPASLVGEYLAGAASTEWVGRSRDESHIYFTSNRRLVPEAPVVDPSLAVTYEWVDGQIRLVGVLPDGTPYPGWTRAATAANFIEQPLRNQAISAVGRRLFWTTVGDQNGDAIYLREDGERTLVVSASQRSGAVGEVEPGTFLGATQDGGRVYFYSGSQLTDDADASGGLYRWERDGEQLTFLAHVTGLSDMTFYRPVFSQTGERLYFLASDNGVRTLYLWDGSLRAVAPVSDETFLYADRRLRTTRDGRYVAFTTTQSLDPRHADGTVAIYRYDSETGERVCASCRTDGLPTVGPAEFSPSESRYAILSNPRNTAARSFTTDGRLFFQTPDPLVADDTNAAVDVYEFDGANATLISSGTGSGSELVDNSDDGSSVFFTTAQALLKRDVDGGFPDVYVARVGGGFPEPDDGPSGCEGDACQGSPTPPPPLAPMTSEFVEPASGEDDDRPRGAAPSIERPSERALRRFAASGRVTLRVRVAAAGRLTATARARIGRRQRTVATATARVRRAGSATLVLRLSAVARRQLAHGALRLRVTVRHSAAAAPATIALSLRQVRARRTGARRGAPAKATTDRAEER